MEMEFCVCYGNVLPKCSLSKEIPFPGRKYDVTLQQRMCSKTGLEWAVCGGWDCVTEVTYFFYRGHSVVLLLTLNKIYILPSDITCNLVYYNIYGRLFSVN